jgi:hypothetical protein
VLGPSIRDSEAMRKPTDSPIPRCFQASQEGEAPQNESDTLTSGYAEPVGQHPTKLYEKDQVSPNTKQKRTGSRGEKNHHQYVPE